MVVCEWCEAPKHCYTDPPQLPGWRVAWTVQNALRTAIVSPAALKVVEAAEDTPVGVSAKNGREGRIRQIVPRA